MLRYTPQKRYFLLMSFFTGLVGYPSDDINKFLWMVCIGGGVDPHIKEPDYLVSDYQKKVITNKKGLGFFIFAQRNWMIL
jgi:hypothetical protein